MPGCAAAARDREQGSGGAHRGGAGSRRPTAPRAPDRLDADARDAGLDCPPRSIAPCSPTNRPSARARRRARAIVAGPRRSSAAPPAASIFTLRRRASSPRNSRRSCGLIGAASTKQPSLPALRWPAWCVRRAPRRQHQTAGVERLFDVVGELVELGGGERVDVCAPAPDAGWRASAGCEPHPDARSRAALALERVLLKPAVSPTTALRHCGRVRDRRRALAADDHRHGRTLPARRSQPVRALACPGRSKKGPRRSKRATRSLQKRALAARPKETYRSRTRAVASSGAFRRAARAAARARSSRPAARAPATATCGLDSLPRVETERAPAHTRARSERTVSNPTSELRQRATRAHARQRQSAAMPALAYCSHRWRGRIVSSSRALGPGISKPKRNAPTPASTWPTCPRAPRSDGSTARRPALSAARWYRPFVRPPRSAGEEQRAPVVPLSDQTARARRSGVHRRRHPHATIESVPVGTTSPVAGS